MSDHLNYFIPYESHAETHENRLTRGWLALLRLVPAVQWALADRIRRYQLEKGSNYSLPSFPELARRRVAIRNQVAGQRLDPGNNVISMLISDTPFEPIDRVEWSERNSIYDGVISYGEEWTIIVENKPKGTGVSSNQLRPSRKGIDVDQVVLDPIPVVVLWHDLIDDLNAFVSGGAIGRTATELIEQFLEFVDTIFPDINPFHSFDVCKNKPHLLAKRCRMALDEIAPGQVEYHRSWDYVIKIPDEPVQSIALEVDTATYLDDWGLDLTMYPGDTVRQARKLYTSTFHADRLAALSKEERWSIKPHLKLSYASSGLVWPTVALGLDQYAAYWLSHPGEIGKKPRGSDDFDSIIAWLEAEAMFHRSHDTVRFEEHFKSTARESVNICPGLRCHYTWTGSEARELDRRGEFVDAVKERIDQVFDIWESSLDAVIL